MENADTSSLYSQVYLYIFKLFSVHVQISVLIVAVKLPAECGWSLEHWFICSMCLWLSCQGECCTYIMQKGISSLLW